MLVGKQTGANETGGMPQGSMAEPDGVAGV
jgi:hypothetical protein